MDFALSEEQQAFQEIEVLRWYYDDKLDFIPYEREELLRVTGEYGSSYYERLDMPETTAKTPQALSMRPRDLGARAERDGRASASG